MYLSSLKTVRGIYVTYVAGAPDREMSLLWDRSFGDECIEFNVMNTTQLDVTWTEDHVTDHSSFITVCVRLQGRDSARVAGAPARGAPLTWGRSFGDKILILDNIFNYYRYIMLM